MKKVLTAAILLAFCTMQIAHADPSGRDGNYLLDPAANGNAGMKNAAPESGPPAAATDQNTVKSPAESRAESTAESTEPAPGRSQEAPLTLEDRANTAFWRRHFDAAKKRLTEIMACRSVSDELLTRCRVNLAIVDTQLELLSDAKKEAQLALKSAPQGSMLQADALVIDANCYARTDEISKAQEKYEAALSIAREKLGEWNCDLAPIYEGIGACQIRQKNWQAARTTYLKLAQLDMLKYGPDDTHVAWSLLSLTQVLQNLNESEMAQTIYKKVFWNFRHQNELRIIKEAGDKADAKFKENLIRSLYGFKNGYADQSIALDLLKSGIPADVLEKPALTRPHNFNNWYRERVGREEAPGLAFFDPTVPLKGIIVTIHGLGLSHNAFTPFAESIQHEGFGVVSFDVRGFGTYRNDILYQKVEFNDIIGDFTRILKALRRDYEGVPLFVLGESMGGAIALRLAAVEPEIVDGVVSSVPSGSRFHAKSTAIEVAVNLLKNKSKQIDIGKRIVKQATTDVDLRENWKSDPSYRLRLSASELLDFQKFMNDNLEFAAKIEHTPVIIFQGYSDQLVKPLGTLALYQAIKCKDKDLFFVGHAEHLIFEESQFDPEIVVGLVSWLKRHSYICAR